MTKIDLAKKAREPPWFSVSVPGVSCIEATTSPLDDGDVVASIQETI